MKIFVLLPLLIVLGGCSKAPVAETENKGSQQQEVKEKVKPEEPVAEAKPPAISTLQTFSNLILKILSCILSHSHQ